MPIQIMSETLASQVAAGEVIERPASVVRELIENSLDAGARRIEVEARQAGTALLVVRDDGGGMDERDARLSLERHATSKLLEVGDLERIETLGFRGEALPSIASVSRLTLRTRRREDAQGWEVRVEGGRVREVRAVGCAPGTEVRVEDLFFNTPARREFLRSAVTEAGHLDEEVRRHALASPEVSWRLEREGREVFSLPATRDRRARIAALGGEEVRRELREVKAVRREGLQVEGALLPGALARRNRRSLSLFLNGRPLDDPELRRAVRAAYGPQLEAGYQPVVWLWLSVDPREVDVNVHPAKQEVRFRRGSKVPAALRSIVEEVLAGERPGWVEVRGGQGVVGRVREAGTAAWPGAVRGGEAMGEVSREVAGEVRREAFWVRDEGEQKELFDGGEVEEGPGRAALEVKGRLGERYLLGEGPEGLVLLDLRAARERILLEQWLGQRGEVAQQGLLVAQHVELSPLEARQLLDGRELFAEAGFALEDFGGGTVRIDAVPAFLRDEELPGLLRGLLDEWGEGKALREASEEAYRRLVGELAHRSARATAWEHLSESQWEALVEELFRCEQPYLDGRGRPTMVSISFSELRRRFRL